MFRSSKELLGFKLGATDGEIGRVKDFYFDDEHWTMRHLVADTGSWLPKRRVLISPYAIAGVRDGEKLIEVSLTKKQIEDSPSVTEDQPVSRQREMEYYNYYGWPYYWNGPYVWGVYPYPHALTPPFVEPPPHDKTESASRQKGDPHLRSANEVKGYHIRAVDDEFGHVDDFLFDDKDWMIRYAVVDTKNWWPGKRVLIPPQWFSSIEWHRSQVRLELDRETVKGAPEYDPSKPITRNYEEHLFRYYQREPYWQAKREMDRAA